MQKVTPFLWFDSSAEEAVNFYVSVFRNSKIDNVSRYPEGGAVMTMEFTLFGQDFIALNGGPMMQFSGAISFLVSCEDQAEVDEYWSKLVEGGGEPRCGWITDKFGITWQIIPKLLGQLLGSPDLEKKQRVMKAMMSMAKIDCAALQTAADATE